jgi:hypothetical protein
MTNPKTKPNTRSHYGLEPMTPLEKYLSALFIVIGILMIAKWQIDRHAAIYAVLDQMNAAHTTHNGELK